ncbi:MAG: DUF1574 domain-containing protein [Leptolyngbya sp.]|nr:MAG: DUF1574 domain-containing protein [Leptolyngbya sp.]
MLNADGQLPLSSGTPQKSAIARRHLEQWLQQVFGQSQAHIKIRLKGNHLHILIESDPSPEIESIVGVLSQALASDSDHSLPLGSTPLKSAHIHRLIVYGRTIGGKQPLWTKAIDLNWNAPAILGDRAATAPLENSEQPGLAQTDPVAAYFAQAQAGEPNAIARYLSSALSSLSVAVRAKTEAVHPGQPSLSSPDLASPSRLIIVCESPYSPDLALLRDVIAQRLRELELQQIRDAIVFGQVSGESRHEWVLRVDLTPAEDILKDWARWGDVQAIAQLLNRQLVGRAMELSALLKDSTLHLSCAGSAGTVPNQARAISAIEPVLQRLLPQGLQATALYGVTTVSSTAITAPPAWVHWLELPAAHNSELAIATLDLARQGNLAAITFLLTRLVNPDLSAKLATGGIRVQIRQKAGLLHIMTDAPNCPRQDAVAAPIARFLKPLHIASVSGVRVYGRRSGQRLPLWHYGLDFSGDRLVPAATPEFAASDIHVDELLSPAGAMVPWSSQPISDRKPAIAQILEQTLEKIQRLLIQTQFFIPLDSAPLTPTSSTPEARDTPSRQRLGIGLVWSIVGLLLVLQTDWLLGYWLQLSSQTATTQTQTATAPLTSNPKSATATLSNLSLSKKASDPTAFNASSFTQPGETILSLPRSPDSPNAKVLPASPMQAKADTLATTLNYPSFNSRQFDRQLAVYKSYLEIFGAPDVLVVGSSRALRGIDPVALEKALVKQGYPNVQIFNFGINGATAQVVDLLVQHVLPQDKLPKLLLFADGARAFNSARMDITYNGMVTSEGYRTLTAGKPPIASTTMAQAPTAKPQPNDTPASVTEEVAPATTNRYQQINEALTKQLGGLSAVYTQRDRLKTRLREQLISLMPPVSSGVLASSDSLINSSSPAAAASSAPSLSADGQGMIDIDGFLPLPIRFNPVTYYQKYARVSGDYDSDYESFRLEGVQTEAMIAIAKYAQSKKLPLVFVNLPLTQEYLDPSRKRHEDAFQQHMLSLAPEFSFIYRDLSSTLATQPDYFSDPSHLNRYGAYTVSQRLAEDVMIPWQIAK